MEYTAIVVSWYLLNTVCLVMGLVPLGIEFMRMPEDVGPLGFIDIYPDDGVCRTYKISVKQETFLRHNVTLTCSYNVTDPTVVSWHVRANRSARWYQAYSYNRTTSVVTTNPQLENNVFGSFRGLTASHRLLIMDATESLQSWQCRVEIEECKAFPFVATKELVIIFPYVEIFFEEKPISRCWQGITIPPRHYITACLSLSYPEIERMQLTSDNGNTLEKAYNDTCIRLKNPPHPYNCSTQVILDHDDVLICNVTYQHPPSQEPTHQTSTRYITVPAVDSTPPSPAPALMVYYGASTQLIGSFRPGQCKQMNLNISQIKSNERITTMKLRSSVMSSPRAYFLLNGNEANESCEEEMNSNCWHTMTCHLHHDLKVEKSSALQVINVTLQYDQSAHYYCIEPLYGKCITPPVKTPMVTVFGKGTNKTIQHGTSCQQNKIVLQDLHEKTEIGLRMSVLSNPLATVTLNGKHDVDLHCWDFGSDMCPKKLCTIDIRHAVKYGQDVMVDVMYPDLPPWNFCIRIDCYYGIVTAPLVVVWGDLIKDTFIVPAQDPGSVLGDTCTALPLLLDKNLEDVANFTISVTANSKPRAEFIVSDNLKWDFKKTIVCQQTEHVCAGIMTCNMMMTFTPRFTKQMVAVTVQYETTHQWVFCLETLLDYLPTPASTVVVSAPTLHVVVVAPTVAAALTVDKVKSYGAMAGVGAVFILVTVVAGIVLYPLRHKLYNYNPPSRYETPTIPEEIELGTIEEHAEDTENDEDEDDSADGY